LQPKAVVIPYSEALADLTRPAAVRLRRDFGKLLALIQIHALLHQGSRSRDQNGRIIAKFTDYERVRR